MKKFFAAAALLSLFAVPVFADETAAPAGAAAPAAAPAEQVPAAAPAPKKAKAAMPAADNAAKEAEIKKEFEGISQAWADGDAKKLASHFLLDGSLINPFGKDAWSRAEVEQVASADMEMMKGSTQTFSDFKFTWILGGCALVDCTGMVSGMKAPDGTAAPDKQFHVVSVIVQRGNKWLARAVRPYAYAPMPGAPSAAPAAADAGAEKPAADKKDSGK